MEENFRKNEDRSAEELVEMQESFWAWYARASTKINSGEANVAELLQFNREVKRWMRAFEREFDLALAEAIACAISTDLKPENLTIKQ